MLVDFQLLIKESKLIKFILLFIETKLCAFDLRYGDNKKNIYIRSTKLVGKSEEDLFLPRNCFNEIHTMGRGQKLRLMGFID